MDIICVRLDICEWSDNNLVTGGTISPTNIAKICLWY